MGNVVDQAYFVMVTQECTLERTSTTIKWICAKSDKVRNQMNIYHPDMDSIVSPLFFFKGLGIK